MAYKLYRLINKALTINLYIMKANVDFPKRVKNSFIYFQVGLIATMLVVLFILEFNFKDGSKSTGYVPPIEISSEPTFVFIIYRLIVNNLLINLYNLYAKKNPN